MKQLRITVAGQTFDVTVETIGGNSPAAAPACAAPLAAVAAAPVAIAAPVLVAAPVVTAPVSAGVGTPVSSPLAGKIVSLDVAVGSSVKEGDQIITLEAMKMNTVISAPCDGVIGSFAVIPGDTVMEGQSLAFIA